MKSISLLTVFLSSMLLSFYSHAQSLWTDLQLHESRLHSKSMKKMPKTYRLMILDPVLMKEALKMAITKNNCVEIPLPNGGFECFEIKSSPIMHPDLAAKYPNIKTFAGRSVANPHHTIRFVWTSDEFHASSFTEKGAFSIDKVMEGDRPVYISYYRKDRVKVGHSCGTSDYETNIRDNTFDENKFDNIPELDLSVNKSVSSALSVGTELRTYRFALAVAGEVTVSLGGVGPTMIQVVNHASDLNLLFERDLCIRLELIPDNDDYIFPDPATDPYSGNGLGSWMDDNIAFMNTTIGVANFDIGHVINPTSGGVAYVGVTCFDGYKAGGTSSNELEVLAHEIGHQLGGTHTFNYCGGSGGGYEPGSGNTTMSYFGLCGANNMPGIELIQYHTTSYDLMVQYRNAYGSNCGEVTLTNNDPPAVTVPSGGFTIPVSTPFTLSGSASDDGGSAALTYLWEQNDLGVNSTPPHNPTGPAPIFRSLPYTSDASRTFPALPKIINGTSDIGEVLPTYTRDLNFRFMVHDNNVGGGGVDYGELMFHVDENAGPFEVLVPNDNTTVWSPGQTRTVEWDVANTDVPPVNCTTVNILASFDGGYTYPETLASAVPNDGEHDIIVPDNPGIQTRIKIEAADNVFFDISDENFEIVPPGTYDFILSVDPKIRNFCSATSTDYEIDILALGAFSSTVDLEISDLPSGVSSNLPATVASISTTTLTLNGLSSLALGQYKMTISATETNGSLSYSQDIYLVIQGAAEDVPGNSMEFDGSNYVSIPQVGGDYQFGTDRNFSVECWIKTSDFSNDNAIVTHKDWEKNYNDGWVLATFYGKIIFLIGDGSSHERVISPTNVYADGEWHHIAATFDRTGSGMGKLYIDGDFVKDTDISDLGDINHDLNLSIGGDAYNNYNYTGEVEEIRIWRKVLTETEVRENMHRTLSNCQPDLISYYQFNESSGDVTDPISFYDGSNSGALRLTSATAVGPGVADSKIESNGTVTFTGTNLTANYTSQAGAEVTVTRIDITPFNTSGVDPAETIMDNQYWATNRYEQSGNLEADFTFGVSEDITATDEASPVAMKLYHRPANSDANWSFLTNASSASAANNTVTFSAIGQYGQFLISRNSSALPLELISFDAIPNNKSIDLNWRTEHEVDVAGYEILRSENDIRSWKAIGWLDSYNDIGPRQYTFKDEHILENQLYYYKLKMIDVDGQYSYSDVESAIIKGDQQLVKIYPNPVNDKLQIRINATHPQPVGMTVYNTLGKAVFKNISEILNTDDRVDLDVSAYPNGIYWLEVQFLESGELQMTQFLKD